MALSRRCRGPAVPGSVGRAGQGHSARPRGTRGGIYQSRLLPGLRHGIVGHRLSDQRRWRALGGGVTRGAIAGGSRDRQQSRTSRECVATNRIAPRASLAAAARASAQVRTRIISRVQLATAMLHLLSSWPRIRSSPTAASIREFGEVGASERARGADTRAVLPPQSARRGNRALE